jgi:hypothetical protein
MLKMRKTLWIITIIIAILGITYLSLHKYLPPYSAYKSASLISGLRLSKDYNLERDTSVFTFTGEGYTEFIFCLDDIQFENLIEKNDLTIFESLPIMRVLPPAIPDYFYNYLDSDILFKYYMESDNPEGQNAMGYYYLNESIKSESFNITVIDTRSKQILIYSFYD